jgi:hypothetical protein
VIGAGYLTYKALSWLTQQAQEEMTRLEKDLAMPQATHTTTADAQQLFERTYSIAKSRIRENPLLKGHGTSLAGVLALKNSPLGLFVDDAEWKRFTTKPPTTTSIDRILARASARFTEANAAHVANSIKDAVAEIGFCNTKTFTEKGRQKLLIVEDVQGRAVVGTITASDEGAKVKLDLTGFGDGTCHEMMDRILSALAARNILVQDIKRRSHYRRTGVMLTELGPTTVTPSQSKGRPEDTRSADGARRRANLSGRQAIRTQARR